MNHDLRNFNSDGSTLTPDHRQKSESSKKIKTPNDLEEWLTHRSKASDLIYITLQWVQTYVYYFSENQMYSLHKKVVY